MARRKVGAPIELRDRHDLSVQLIADLRCPEGKGQAFLRDTESPSLRVRVTSAGAKAFVFESKLRGSTIRHTIGAVDNWTIPKARAEANRLRRLVDLGNDPREIERKEQAAAVAERETEQRRMATVAEAWAVYLQAHPKWSAHHLDDHVKLAQAGGAERSNRKGVKTIAGPLAVLMPMLLRDLDDAAVRAWVAKETPARPARVRLALRLLKAFLRWCAAEPAYKESAHATAASGKKTREAAGKARRKDDYIQRDQLQHWFRAVQGIPNRVIATYLQCLLLTGARREELAAVRWSDVNFQWKTIAMKDKIEGNRMVPLTPYVSRLVDALPRANEWVFSSARFVMTISAGAGKWVDTSASGRLTEPSIAHRQACAVVGLDGLTLHGLRRSFASLCEWVEIPGGISAQIQGHAPQGVREQNYIRRPIDLLRLHHERIEAWILEQAGIALDPATTRKLEIAA